MQMPENYKVEDGKLTIFVDELEFEFLEKSDFIYSDKGKILLKHHAITVLAQGAGITVGMPVLLSSHDSNSFVIAREAIKQNGARYSAIGEANTKNLWSEYPEQYPAETADNRAYDRAVLGIAGVYGKIYSTSEFSYQDAEHGEKKAPKKEPAIVETEKLKQEPQNESTATGTSEKHPIWWNDIGIGIYTDKQLDPETFIVTQGQCKDKNWTVKQLYHYKYDSCYYFATRTLENAPSEEFTMQVYACRRAIRTYGLKQQEKSA